MQGLADEQIKASCSPERLFSETAFQFAAAQPHVKVSQPEARLWPVISLTDVCQN